MPVGDREHHFPPEYELLPGLTKNLPHVIPGAPVTLPAKHPTEVLSEDSEQRHRRTCTWTFGAWKGEAWDLQYNLNTWF